MYRLFRNRSQVLRAFLKDFDDKMEIQDEASPMEASVDIPGVASSDPTSVKAFGEPWATDATEEPPVARPASARLQGARRVSTAPSSTRLQGAPAAKRAAPARPVSSSPAGRSRRATLWNAPHSYCATAHCPGLLGWTLQAPGCTTHSRERLSRPAARGSPRCCLQRVLSSRGRLCGPLHSAPRLALTLTLTLTLTPTLTPTLRPFAPRLASAPAARLEPRAALSPDEPGTPRDAG